jgi:hypothetical protein
MSGRYLWNHANGSMLRDFLVNEYIGGEAGLANPNIDGIATAAHTPRSHPPLLTALLCSLST